MFCWYEGWLPVPTVGGLTLLRRNVVNRAESDIQVSVWQYGVFIIKLIMSYLPVYLTNSLPSSPLQVGCLGLELRLEGWGVLPVGSNHSARRSDRQHSGVITLNVRVICRGNER